LSWSGMRWAGQAKPDVISLENVLAILKWGPLIAKRDKATGRVIKLVTQIVKGKKKVRQVVAEPGERVPVQQQYLIPDPKREGETWKKFVRKLQAMGYAVEWRALVAAKLGGHTTRKRLFMIARRDGYPIIWPEQIHFESPTGKQMAYKPAADCIDFSNQGKSIFGRKKELAPATKRRIAKGIKKFVLDNPKPFIVNNMMNNVPRMVDEPMATCCGGNHKYLATPSIVPIAHYNGQDVVHSALEPLRTVKAATKGGEFAVATPIIVPATHQGSDRMHSVEDSLPTITTAHRGELMLATPVLSPSKPAGPSSAFMMQANDGFNATIGRGLDESMTSITTRDRLALVTVFIKGDPYVIVDIRLRMLTPRELARGQDFPEDYIIDRGHDGRKFSVATQVRMIGNSVNPVMAEAFLRANAPWLAVKKAA